MYIMTTIIDRMYAPASDLRTIFYFIIYIMYLCVSVYAPPRISPKQIHIYIKILSIKHMCTPAHRHVYLYLYYNFTEYVSISHL